MHRKCCTSRAIVCATFSAFKVFSLKKAFIMIQKIKVSDSKIKKFLMEPSTFSAQAQKMKKIHLKKIYISGNGNLKIFLIISQKKAFPIFQETETSELSTCEVWKSNN